jgi:hypothetical protein
VSTIGASSTFVLLGCPGCTFVSPLADIQTNKKTNNQKDLLWHSRTDFVLLSVGDLP